MPLNAGDTGYGSVPGSRLPGSAEASESAPLLIPEPEPEPVHRWRPLSREELEAAAGGPGWRRVRCYLVLLFWLAWLAMLATSVAIIMMSPRPVVTPLRWWQKSLFYRLRPDLLMEEQTEGAEGIGALCSQLPYLQSLGIGALILEGLFDKNASPLNITAASERSRTLAQLQHLLAESNKAGLKVVLDFCGLDLLGPLDADKPSNLSASLHVKAYSLVMLLNYAKGIEDFPSGSLFQEETEVISLSPNPPDFLEKDSNTGVAHLLLHLFRALRVWLEHGVAGFAICDTDAAYSEKTLREWRGVFEEFNKQEEERILVVKQTQNALPPLQSVTLVDVVMRSILPSSHHLQSAEEVADAIETRLQTREGDIWPSWTVGGEASHDLKKLLLVLVMTLPGSPAVQYDEDINQAQNVSLKVSSSHAVTNMSDTHTDKEKTRRSAVALFTSLSRSRAREEALLYGGFTFLPFNSSNNASSSSTVASPSSLPVLAFLRSWGCVHFLILLNVGPERHALDPTWAPSLPKAGVFVSSTGMDRLGSMTLDTLELRPHEAIVIKLFVAGSYS